MTVPQVSLEMPLVAVAIRPLVDTMTTPLVFLELPLVKAPIRVFRDATAVPISILVGITYVAMLSCHRATRGAWALNPRKRLQIVTVVRGVSMVSDPIDISWVW